MVDQISRIFAHSFNTDDVSYVLGLDKRTKVELELAEKNYFIVVIETISFG